MANIKRLEQLEYMLRHHNLIFPETRFNINYWVKDFGPLDKRKKPNPLTKMLAWVVGKRTTFNCGFAACALGSAANYPAFMQEGLQMRHGEPVYEGSNPGYSSGAAFFGITYHQSTTLFDPDEYEGNPTASDVADRVRVLIDNA